MTFSSRLIPNNLLFFYFIYYYIVFCSAYALKCTRSSKVPLIMGTTKIQQDKSTRGVIMKKVIFSAAIIFSLALAGCGSSSEESLDGSVNNETSTNDTTNNENEAVDESAGEETESINEVIVDNDMYKITLLEILKKEDEIWGNTIEVVYEVENRLDYTIGVQGRSVSADGYMVDESIYSMSQEVVGGKKAKAVLTINDFEGYDFPELNNDLEMTLVVFNYDSFEDIAEHPVKVTF